MAERTSGAAEVRNYWRSPDIPGFEFIEATASSAPWQIYNVAYAVSLPETWAARVNLDGQMSDLAPGQAFLVRPGEFHSCDGAAHPGTLRALVMLEQGLEQYAGEHLAEPTKLDWMAATPRCSTELVEAYSRVFHALHSASTKMQFQATMVDFFAVMLRELVAGSRLHERVHDRSRQATLMRELIHHSVEGLTLGLDDLARAVGLTRFQALRAFKRKYGIPPHTYQLAVRVGLAVPLLMQGESVTRVAHELGFTDQSHFTRHFKRVWRMTPGHYARGARPTPFAERRLCTSHSDGVSFSV